MNDITGQVVIIDDDRDFSLSLIELLQGEGYQVTAFDNANTALNKLDETFPGVVLLDIRMPEVSGQEVLSQLIAKDASLPVIHITGHGDIPMAVEAVKQGAYGFFTKPLAVEDLLRDINNALSSRRTELQRRELASQLAVQNELASTVIGASPQIVKLRQQIAMIGRTDVDVLVQGETGTGKELVVQALVQHSSRSDDPLVAVNCGHVSHQQAAEEMFGIETLLATGESNIRHGHFERANGGTILLDEVESMPPDMQAKLLRVLQERTLERISGVLPVPLDIRVIATTKVALHNLVTDGRFRQDLYYRLSGVELQLPPLRERGTDVVMLFMHFLAQNGGATEIPPALISDLLSHDWPGNVRELRNAAGRYAAGLSVFAEDDKQRKNSLAARVADFEKGLIEAALAQNNGSLKRTMLDLDVPRKTLYDKMNKHEIQKEKFHNDD